MTGLLAVCAGLDSGVMDGVYGAAQAGGQQAADEVVSLCIAAVFDGQVLTCYHNLKLNAFLTAWYVSEAWETQRGDQSEKSMQAQVSTESTERMHCFFSMSVLAVLRCNVSTCTEESALILSKIHLK